MKSIILALLPGLEDDTSEEFERTLSILESFKEAIRPPNSEIIIACHSTGDHFFWQCFFLASITGQSRRQGALAYLSRNLPTLTDGISETKGPGTQNGAESDIPNKLSAIITSPEPGLLVRCFSSGLGDEQLLIQRGYLDLLVTHLPLNSRVLQSKVKQPDLEILLKAAVGVVTRRDMSLNRRLWAWLLGPDPGHAESDPPQETPQSPTENHQDFTSRTRYFEEFGLQALSQALLGMVNTDQKLTPVERARPYRICLSLMDRWEIGGLVVPEVFMPIVDSVRNYKSQSASRADFDEVLRSACVFFDGVESGLIYGEVVGLLARAIGPGKATSAERMDKIALANFIISNFNIREEEMVTIHAPLTVLFILGMLGTAKEMHRSRARSDPQFSKLPEAALNVAATLLDLVPGRAFPSETDPAKTESTLASMVDNKLLDKISSFYLNDQGNIDIAPPPFHARMVGELLLMKASLLNREGLLTPDLGSDLPVKTRILILLLLKIPEDYQLDGEPVLAAIHKGLKKATPVRFASLSAMLSLATHLYTSELITTSQLSGLVVPLTRHVWSYLSLSDPRYHVEAVRCLWQLQTALTPQNRDIEAAVSGLMIENNVNGSFSIRPSEPGRTFSVLWSHSLQDNPSHLERRGNKTPVIETRLGTMQRLVGVDHYEVMLTQPLFIMLDALLDERTQLFMAAKAWLHTMIGIDRYCLPLGALEEFAANHDRLFLVFISKFADLPFLRRPLSGGDTPNPDSTIQLTEDDDLDLCIYYLRNISLVLRWAPETIWAVLGKTTVPGESVHLDLSKISEYSSFTSHKSPCLQPKQPAWRATYPSRSSLFMSACGAFL
ncbi:hypothetical protein IMZ48_36350 [Candidatus Bathyarchaeota archaeon]|nr:hypothetical protein [Candidatus Bathyarchaeota archaeon]